MRALESILDVISSDEQCVLLKTDAAKLRAIVRLNDRGHQGHQTFWLDYFSGQTSTAGEAPERTRCNLERLALAVMHHHTPADGCIGVGLHVRGVEWWVQSRSSSASRVTHPWGSCIQSRQPSMGLHFDSDEELKGATGEHKTPWLATITYLGSRGAPTVVLPVVGDCEGHAELLPETSAASGTFVSYPVAGKHVAFDGGLLHGVLAEMSSEGPADPDEPYVRCTLLVNIWCSHRPLAAVRLPAEIAATLSNSPQAAFFAGATALPATLAPQPQPRDHGAGSHPDQDAWTAFDVGFIPERALCAAHPDWHTMTVKGFPFAHPSLGLRRLMTPPSPAVQLASKFTPAPSLFFAPFVEIRLDEAVAAAAALAAAIAAATLTAVVAGTTEAATVPVGEAVAMADPAQAAATVGSTALAAKAAVTAATAAAAALTAATAAAAAVTAATAAAAAVAAAAVAAAMAATAAVARVGAMGSQADDEPTPDKNPTFESYFTALPTVVRQCLVEGEEVDACALVEALQTINEHVDEYPTETALDLLSVKGAIDAAGCETLRRAVDATRSVVPDSVDQMPEHQLDLSRDELEGYIGSSTVAKLWRLPRRLASQRESGVPGETSDEPPANRWANPEPQYRVVLFVRRYCRETRPMINFHRDTCAVTVNVALAADEAHMGGRLLAILDDGLHEIRREEGEATVHPSDVLHAVTAVREGVRYSLLLFFFLEALAHERTEYVDNHCYTT